VRRKRNLPNFYFNGFLGLCNAHNSLAARTNKHGHRDIMLQSLEDRGDNEWERFVCGKKGSLFGFRSESTGGDVASHLHLLRRGQEMRVFDTLTITLATQRAYGNSY